MKIQEGKSFSNKLIIFFHSLFIAIFCVFINVAILPQQVHAFNNTSTYTYVDNSKCALTSRIWSSYTYMWQDQTFLVGADATCYIAKTAEYTRCSYYFDGYGMNVSVRGISTQTGGGSTKVDNSVLNSSHCSYQGMYQIQGWILWSNATNATSTKVFFKPVSSAVGLSRTY